MTDAASALPIVATAALAALRVVPLTVAMPVFGGRTLPPWSRAPIVLVIAAGAAPFVLDARADPIDAVSLVLAATRELTIGLALALIVGTPFFALEHGARLLDSVRGGGEAEGASTLSVLLRWTFGAAFLAAGGLRSLVRIVASSFAAYPPDVSSGRTIDTAHLVEVVARWTSNAVAAGFTLVSAAVISLLAAEIVLALACRLSPPLSRSNPALPVRALLPLTVLALAAGAWTGAARDLAGNSLRAAASLGP